MLPSLGSSACWWSSSERTISHEGKGEMGETRVCMRSTWRQCRGEGVFAWQHALLLRDCVQ